MRSRQARYQAALRPDIDCFIHSKALPTLLPIPGSFWPFNCDKNSCPTIQRHLSRGRFPVIFQEEIRTSIKTQPIRRGANRGELWRGCARHHRNDERRWVLVVMKYGVDGRDKLAARGLIGAGVKVAIEAREIATGNF